MGSDYDLAQSNYHAAPGDILLLKSLGKGVLNRTGQWLQRGQPARFTHVAVVVDGTRIVDAMPKVGVSFRVWRDIEADCDIEASRVARLDRLARDPTIQRQVLEAALYFVKQPYKLRTVELESDAIVDQSGMVCSHFAAALMERLGVAASAERPTATLPVDIDEYTRTAEGWRQFALKDSILHSGAATPRSDDPYWDAAYRFVYAQLSQEDRARLDEGQAAASAQAAELVSRGDLSGLIERADQALADAKAHNAAFEALFADSVDLQYSASRNVQAFEAIMLALTEGLANGSEEALKVSMALLESDGPLGGKVEPLTGAGFFSQWEALYRKDELPTVFLHEQSSAGNRERHRLLLDQAVHKARELAASHLQMFEDLSRTVAKIIEALKAMVVPPEALAQVADAADALRESAWFLRGEDVDVVSKRVEQLGDRSAALVQWAKDAWKDGQGLDKEVILRGGETYHEICRYDLDTLNWLRLEPVLVKWAAALRGQ